MTILKLLYHRNGGLVDNHLLFTDVYDVEDHEIETLDGVEKEVEHSRDYLDDFFQQLVCQFPGGRSITKTKLSDNEYQVVCTVPLMQATGVAYQLMDSHTSKTFDEQLPLVLDALNFFSAKRLPKQYAGGFLILATKYHFLPN